MGGATGITQKTGLSNWALWFGGLAFFTCYLGQTILGVVRPTVATDLRLSASEEQWPPPARSS